MRNRSQVKRAKERVHEHQLANIAKRKRERRKTNATGDRPGSPRREKKRGGDPGGRRTGRQQASAARKSPERGKAEGDISWRNNEWPHRTNGNEVQAAYQGTDHQSREGDTTGGPKAKVKTRSNKNWESVRAQAREMFTREIIRPTGAIQIIKKEEGWLNRVSVLTAPKEKPGDVVAAVMGVGGNEGKEKEGLSKTGSSGTRTTRSSRSHGSKAGEGGSKRESRGESNFIST